LFSAQSGNLFSLSARSHASRLNGKHTQDNIRRWKKSYRYTNHKIAFYIFAARNNFSTDSHRPRDQPTPKSSEHNRNHLLTER